MGGEAGGRCHAGGGRLRRGVGEGKGSKPNLSNGDEITLIHNELEAPDQGNPRRVLRPLGGQDRVL